MIVLTACGSEVYKLVCSHPTSLIGLFYFCPSFTFGNEDQVMGWTRTPTQPKDNVKKEIWQILEGSWLKVRNSH